MADDEFRELNEIIKPLVLPINGKRYTIPPVSMEDGLRLNTVEDVTALPTPEFRTIFLGAAFDEMVKDGVSAQMVSRAALTALTDFEGGRAAAHLMWETGGDPKALKEWQDSQPTVNRLPESKRSRKPVAATTTRRRASGTTTKTSQPAS